MEQERRHRIHEEEVPIVIEGLRMYLTKLLEEKGDLQTATIAFKPFLRLVRHQIGCPLYPDPLTWEIIAEYLYGTIIDPLHNSDEQEEAV